MRGNSSIRNSLLLSMVFVLSACAEMRYSSRFLMKQEDSTQLKVLDLQKEIFAKMEKMEGSCKELLGTNYYVGKFHRCDFGKEYLNLNFGLNQKNQFAITLFGGGASYVHQNEWFPEATVSKEYKEMERWLLCKLQGSSLLVSQRNYPDELGHDPLELRSGSTGNCKY